MQGWTWFAPLFVPLVRLLVSWYWRLGPGLAAFLPARVRALLAAPALRADLIRIVRDISEYADLPNGERRELALDTAGTWLRAHGFDLTDHELALLIELVYGWVKRHRPGGTPSPLRRAAAQP